MLHVIEQPLRCYESERNKDATKKLIAETAFLIVSSSAPVFRYVIKTERSTVTGFSMVEILRQLTNENKELIRTVD